MCGIPMQEAFYAVICAYMAEHLSVCIGDFAGHFLSAGGWWESRTADYILLFLTSAAAWAFFAKPMCREGRYPSSAARSAGLLIIVMEILYGLSQYLYRLEMQWVHAMYAFPFIVIILTGERQRQEQMRLQRELQQKESLWALHKTQYEMTRDTIDIINRKCHDMRHEMMAMQTVADAEQRETAMENIRRAVRIYDTAYRTGCESLDTVLMQKALECSQEHIELSVIADGSLLGFMDPVDLYIMMANILDNAIEANKKIPERDRRAIHLSVHEKKTAGWYAPAVNLHRSPFSGRNYEYFSEDPFQTGLIASNIIKTVQQKGVYVYLKHFALNDQETNRNANGQVAVFSREQAIRELYLKPFQMGVESGGAKGIMLSMNRIGTTWSGDHYNLLTAVTRGEWGFEGMFLTDYLGSMDTAMIDKYLAAGGNLVLSTNELKLSNVKDNWCRAYLRTSTHRVLYHQANSLAVNGLGADVKFEVGTPVYKIALWTMMGLLAVYLAYSVFMMIRYGRMTEEQFADSRLRTAKARRIKNIIVLAVIVILLVVFFIVYFPVLQKAFLM